MVKILYSFVVLALVGTAARAQSVPTEPDPENVRVRIGPVWLNPSVALTNLGIDTNVYFQDETRAPESDFTMTVMGQSDVSLRMGRTWLLGYVRDDLVYYHEFDAERSINGNYSLRWLVPLNRLRFVAGGNYIRARERPGYEIDARSLRYERAVNGAAELRALAKTFFGVRGEQRDIEFDKDAVFLGTNLNDELTRTSTTYGVNIRHQLTPLTSIYLDAGRVQDRFKYSPVRDSDSSQVSVGVALAPFALISGSAQFGYRDFKPLNADIPGFTGFTTQADLTYVVLGSTKLGFRALRDLQYSFDIAQPYYLQTGFNLSVAQQVYGPIDVEGRWGRHRLAYRELETNVTGRVDKVRSFGFGVGYRLGTDLRMGFNMDRQERQSEIVGNDYSGWRFGLAVTYGL